MRKLSEILEEGRKPKEKGIFIPDDVQEPYPFDTMVYIQKAVNRNSKDKSKDWNSPIELVDFSLDELNVPRPMAYMKKRWEQYVEMLHYAVRNLKDSRGFSGTWNKNNIV
jgi:hypothetical protein